MTFEQFEINSRKGATFRVAKISPVDLLAITQTIDFENFKATKTLINFCLENAEVKVGEKWLPVKVKDKDIYQPMGIENDFTALNEIFVWMLENVITKTFTKSSESKD